MSRVPFLLLLAFAIAAAGCASQPAPKPAEPLRIVLEETSRKALLEVRMGRELRIELPPPIEPGLVWKLTANDPRFLKLLADVAPPEPGSVRSVCRFQVLRPGRSQLRFHAVPPVELREVRPADAYDVIVSAQ